MDKTEFEELKMYAIEGLRRDISCHKKRLETCEKSDEIHIPEEQRKSLARMSVLQIAEEEKLLRKFKDYKFEEDLK